MKLVSVFVALVAVSGMLGCAGMMREWRTQNCNYDGAYQLGMNDGNARGPMKLTQLHYNCGEADNENVSRGYREGYDRAMSASPTQILVPVSLGGRIPEQQCVTAYGTQACGYGCIQAYGQVRCAHTPGNGCVEAYGQIACGRGCHAEYGKIVCQSYD